ncbi:MAG: hypothetical protein ACTHMB_06745 [Candidatus Binatia bacterium]
MPKGRSFRLLATLALLFFAKEVRSQSADLVQAAKREGKVVIYGSLESDTTDAIKEKFQQKPVFRPSTGALRRPKSWIEL